VKTVIALAVAGLAASAVAQTNNLSYELRLLGDSVNNGDTVSLPSSGGVVSFWLQARVRANTVAANTSNFGVGRATNGPAGQTPAFISVTDSVADTRLARGQVAADGGAGFALTGRGPLHRAGGPVDDLTDDAWHSATQNGTGGALFPSATGNQFGAFDQGGDRIYGFDAYIGPSRSGATNPWVGNFPATALGQFSPWANLYRVDVLVSGNSARSVTVNAAAFLSMFTRAQNIGGGTWLANLTSPTTGAASVTAPAVTFNVIPTPGAAALVGLGALAAGRRRR
jgi:hypothetical protein